MTKMAMPYHSNPPPPPRPDLQTLVEAYYKFCLSEICPGVKKKYFQRFASILQFLTQNKGLN